MKNTQAGILAENNTLSRYMSFTISSEDNLAQCLMALVAYVDTETTVIGIGQSLAGALKVNVEDLKVLNADSSNGIDVPSTPSALWCWLRGTDSGELFNRSNTIESLLSPGFYLNDVVDSFKYEDNRDLSGYIDGTENPSGEEAFQAAVVQGKGEGLDGGSYVAVQQWLHDFEILAEMNTNMKDDVIGRHISDNEEFESAPESAHVKRSAQESFTPEAFMLRRSMPWVDRMDGGLMFVAFATSFKPFESIFDRMLGKEDLIKDGIFSFTKPVTGAYYWCPPIKDGKLDLSILGIN